LGVIRQIGKVWRVEESEVEVGVGKLRVGQAQVAVHESAS